MDLSNFPIDNIQEDVLSLRIKSERLEKENGRLEGKLEDERMEYIELENFMNNKVIKAKDILQAIITRFVDPLEHYEFTEDDKKLLKIAENFLKEE